MSHTFAKENLAIGLVGASAWGAQFSASARYAITGSRRFWVGVTARYYYLKRNSYTTDRLLTVGPGFTFAF